MTRGCDGEERLCRKEAGHLDDDPLVGLVLQDAVCGVRLDLLPDGRGDGGDEGQRAQVQVVAEDLGKHLRRHQLLCRSEETQDCFLHLHHYFNI